MAKSVLTWIFSLLLVTKNFRYNWLGRWYFISVSICPRLFCDFRSRVSRCRFLMPAINSGRWFCKFQVQIHPVKCELIKNIRLSIKFILLCLWEYMISVDKWSKFWARKYVSKIRIYLISHGWDRHQGFDVQWPHSEYVHFYLNFNLSYQIWLKRFRFSCTAYALTRTCLSIFNKGPVSYLKLIKCMALGDLISMALSNRIEHFPQFTCNSIKWKLVMLVLLY